MGSSTVAVRYRVQHFCIQSKPMLYEHITEANIQIPESGQQSRTPPPSRTATTTEPSPRNGFPSHNTKSPAYAWLALTALLSPRICSMLDDTSARASLSLSPACLAAQRASRANPWSLESPCNAKPSCTPASISTFAELSLSGGPGSAFFFSHLSGAPRLPVKITGMPASARGLAT